MDAKEWVLKCKREMGIMLDCSELTLGQKMKLANFISYSERNKPENINKNEIRMAINALLS